MCARKWMLGELLDKMPADSRTESGNPAGPGTPFFDRLLERVGEGRNGFEKLLSEVAGPVDPSTVSQFPTADCLTPEDVHGIEYSAFEKSIENLDTEKQEHLASCPWCQRMVSASQPNGDEFADVLAKARAALRQREEKAGELKDKQLR